jgi:DNA-binding NarL/FixJ family response regulator
MLTAYSHNEYIFEALRAGASGYLLKSIAPDELIASILDVVDGGAPMTGQIARRVIAAFRTTAPKGVEQAQLTPREMEILERLAQGYTNREIASCLGCSAQTVRTHLYHVYEKLHVRCRAGAVAKYLGSPVPAT